MSNQHNSSWTDANSPPPPSENRPGTSQSPSAVNNSSTKRKRSELGRNPKIRPNQDRGLEPDEVDPVCCRRRNCYSKISKETRTRLRREYNEQLDISPERGSAHIRKFMLHCPVKNRRGERRNATYQYHIPNDNEEDVQVCMNGFVLAFGIRERVLRNARNETDGIPILQQNQTKSAIDSTEDTNQHGPNCSCINAKPMCFQSNSVDTLDDFKMLTDWNLYQIHDRTLTILFDEGFDGILSLQSIEEKDLTVFRENKDPEKAIKMAQLILLRRLVQCLNCPHHEPYNKETEQLQHMGPTEGALSVNDNHLSSVSCGTQASAVKHPHSARTVASLPTSTSTFSSPVQLSRASISESLVPPIPVDSADRGSALGAAEVFVRVEEDANSDATLPSESAHFQSNPATYDNVGASTSQQPPRVEPHIEDVANPPSNSSISSFEFTPPCSVDQTQANFLLHAPSPASMTRILGGCLSPSMESRNRSNNMNRITTDPYNSAGGVSNRTFGEHAVVITNTARISGSSSISSQSAPVASGMLQLLLSNVPATSAQSPYVQSSLAPHTTTLPLSSVSHGASLMSSVNQVSLPQTTEILKSPENGACVSSDGGLDILSLAVNMIHTDDGNNDLTSAEITAQGEQNLPHNEGHNIDQGIQGQHRPQQHPEERQLPHHVVTGEVTTSRDQPIHGTASPPQDIHEINKRLSDASVFGNIGEVSKCLQLGAQVHSKTGSFQQNPLHRAASEGHHEVCKLLLQAKAEINAKDKFQDTPLHYAAHKGHEEVCKLLLQANAEVNAKNEIQQTPLHRAASKGHHEVCKLLLQANAEVNAKNMNTPLHYAADAGHEEVCKLLLQANAEVNAKNMIQQTPLHKAAIHGYHKVCKLLLQANAEVNAKGMFQDTPLHDAASKGHHEVCELLLQAKAVVNAKNMDQDTPLHLATRGRHRHVYELLLQNGGDEHATNDKHESPRGLLNTWYTNLRCHCVASKCKGRCGCKNAGRPCTKACKCQGKKGQCGRYLDDTQDGRNEDEDEDTDDDDEDDEDEDGDEDEDTGDNDEDGEQ